MIKRIIIPIEKKAEEFEILTCGGDDWTVVIGGNFDREARKVPSLL